MNHLFWTIMAIVLVIFLLRHGEAADRRIASWLSTPTDCRYVELHRGLR